VAYNLANAVENEADRLMPEYYHRVMMCADMPHCTVYCIRLQQQQQQQHVVVLVTEQEFEYGNVFDEKRSPVGHVHEHTMKWRSHNSERH
jgi:bifunctional N-acetylglucosamine-1-phosphate-uridyltransferase/glucosamine-1-phosphate-acetyltransferase GlmU-like protein